MALKPAWLLTSVTLVSRLSECCTRVGNLPACSFGRDCAAAGDQLSALFKPGPNNLGICGINTCNPEKGTAWCARACLEPEKPGRHQSCQPALAEALPQVDLPWIYIHFTMLGGFLTIFLFLFNFFRSLCGCKQGGPISQQNSKSQSARFRPSIT